MTTWVGSLWTSFPLRYAIICRIENLKIKQFGNQMHQILRSVDYKCLAMFGCFPDLSIYYRNGSHVHNVADRTTELQNVNRLIHAQQNRADSFGSTNFNQQFVGDIARR